jgi:hypothetical protein
MINKIIIFVTALMLTTLISKAQIPNAGFENWDNMGLYSNPSGWGTMNNTTALASVYTAEKGIPGFPGTSYLKLTSKTTPLGVANGIAVSGKLDSLTMQPISGFAYAARPASLNGAEQHMIFGSSPGEISVTLTKWNTNTNMRDVIGIASVTLSGMSMSWATFSIPITYSLPDLPDSCIIVMKASGAAPANQDYLWVDNLNFIGTPAFNTDINSSHFSIYPNPSGDFWQVTKADIQEITGYTLTDVYGKIVSTELINKVRSSFKVPNSNLSAGQYLLTIHSNNTNYNYKLIKN